jgi:Protein of unknown function (DUF3953)
VYFGGLAVMFGIEAWKERRRTWLGILLFVAAAIGSQAII